ncbi:MAG: stalk domain-containing protein [Eubacteriales bacterium]|nr:stalk domain-containing protein [Eubacteriales bacterium]
MKRIACVLLSAFFCLSLAACQAPAALPAPGPIQPATQSTFPTWAPTAPPAATPSATAAADAPPAENAAADAVKLYLNGNRLPLSTPCRLENGVVMVPIAEIVGAFSRSIACTMAGDTLTMEDASRGNTILLTAGDDTASVNGKTVALEAPAMLAEDGALLVELSAFRTLLDADNKFTAEFSAAYIVESGLC